MARSPSPWFEPGVASENAGPLEVDFGLCDKRANAEETLGDGNVFAE